MEGALGTAIAWFNGSHNSRHQGGYPWTTLQQPGCGGAAQSGVAERTVISVLPAHVNRGPQHQVAELL